MSNYQEERDRQLKEAERIEWEIGNQIWQLKPMTGKVFLIHHHVSECAELKHSSQAPTYEVEFEGKPYLFMYGSEYCNEDCVHLFEKLPFTNNEWGQVYWGEHTLKIYDAAGLIELNNKEEQQNGK